MDIADNTYNINDRHNTGNNWKYPENILRWSCCPRCNLEPKVWKFDNGEYTACGCWNTKYQRFSITVKETIGDVVRRTGGFAEYNDDQLRLNWNQYCENNSKLIDLYMVQVKRLTK